MARAEMTVGTVTLPKETIALLKKLAKADDRTMSSYLRVLIAEKAKEANIS